MDDLKTHVDSVHRNDLFKFLCGECGFNAQGPRHLREHVRTVHVGNAATATLAIINLDGDRSGAKGRSGVARAGDVKVVSLEVVSMADQSENRAVHADRSGIVENPRDIEVVSLEVESASDSSGSDESFQCPKCRISFPMKEGLEGHANWTFVCDILRPARTEPVPSLEEFLCGHCGEYCEATVETLESVETGVRSKCPRRFNAGATHGGPEVSSTTLGPTCQDEPDESSEDKDGESRYVANRYPSSNRIRNDNSSNEDYEEDPFFNRPGGAALWSRVRGKPGKIVADWAVGCFQSSLQQLEPHENGEVHDDDGGGVCVGSRPLLGPGSIQCR